MKCQTLFLRENKKPIVNLSSAEYSDRHASVNSVELESDTIECGV